MEKVVSCFISKATLDYVKLHCDQEYPLLFKELDPEIDHLPDPETFLRDPHQCHLMAQVVGSGQPAYFGSSNWLSIRTTFCTRWVKIPFILSHSRTAQK